MSDDLNVFQRAISTFDARVGAPAAGAQDAPAAPVDTVAQARSDQAPEAAPADQETQAREDKVAPEANMFDRAMVTFDSVMANGPGAAGPAGYHMRSRNSAAGQVLTKGPAVEETGVMDELGRGLSHGVQVTIPKMIGQAAQFFGADKIGDSIVKSAEARETDANRESAYGQSHTSPFSVRGNIYEAADNGAMSMGPGAAGAAAGAALGSGVFGIGAIPGALIGYGLGSLAALPMFYGSQGQQTYEKVKKAQLEAGNPEDVADRNARIAGHMTGSIEAGGEVLADAIPFASLLFKPFAKVGAKATGNVVKTMFFPTLKEAGKGFLKVEAGEISTEIAQQLGEDEVEGRFGAGQGADMGEASKVIMPTALMTLIPGLAGAGGRMHQISSARKALESAATDPQARAALAAGAVKEMSGESDDLARAFALYAGHQISNNQAIVIGDDSLYTGFKAEATGVPAELQPIADAAAKPNSPLSRAALAANTGPAADAARAAQADQATAAAAKPADPLAERAAQLVATLKQEGALDALRAEDSPVDVKTILHDLSIAQSPSTPARAREQAMNRLETALEWAGVHPAPAVSPAIEQIVGDAPGGSNTATTVVTAPNPAAQRAVAEGGTPEAAQVGPQPTGASAFDATAAAQARAPAVQAQEESNAAAAAKVAPLPSVDAVVAALKVVPALRSAEQSALVKQAQSRFSPEQMSLISQAAQYAAGMSATDKIKFEALRAPAAQAQAVTSVEAQPTPTEVTSAPAAAAEPKLGTVVPKLGAAPAGEGTAVFRKRRATLRQVIDMGLNRVDRRADGSFVLTDGKKEFKLEGPADAQLARKEVADHVDKKASRADENATEGQINADNYRKGEPISVYPGVTFITENKKDSIRRNKPGAAKKWAIKLRHHYGDLVGTIGADGDKVDAFWVGNGNKIFVIDQVNKDGTFDEHKVMLRARDEKAAREAYLANYEPGWTGLGAITEMTPERLRAWSNDKAATKKAVGDINGKAGSAADGNPEQRSKAQVHDVSGGVADRGMRDGVPDAGSADKPAGQPDAGSGKSRPAGDASAGSDVTVQVNGKPVTLQTVSADELGNDARRDDGKAGNKITRHNGKLVQRMAQLLGKDVVFFRDPEGAIGDGFVQQNDGKIYLNESSTINPLSVMGHEFFHLLKRDLPEAHAAITKVVAEKLKTDEAKALYGDKLKYAHDNILEEATSDLGGDLMGDSTFWSEVFAQIEKDNPGQGKSIIAKLAQKLNAILDKLIAGLKGQPFGAQQLVTDMGAVRDAFKKGLAAHITATGASRVGMQAEILKAGQEAKRAVARSTPIAKDVKRDADGWLQSDDGESMTLLHGTSGLRDDGMPGGSVRPFEKFSASELGKVTKSLDSKAGFWFTSSRERAQQAGEDAVAADDKEESRWTKDPRHRNSFKPYVFNVNLQMKNPLVFDGLRGRSTASVAKLAKQAKEDGHDGLVFEAGENGGSDYLVFKPEQIRILDDAKRSASRDNAADDRTPAANENDPASGLGRGARAPGADAGGAGAVHDDTPSYGTATPGSVSVLARHYSKRARKALSTAAFGTGYAGAEKDRVAAADDARLRDRTYFYLDTGNGIRPESGVGGHAHEVRLNNVYDPNSKLIPLQKSHNAFESAVIDAGFDGYIIRGHSTNQDAVVLLGPQHSNVPVKTIENPGMGRLAPEAAETHIKKGLMSKELNAIDVANIPGATLKAGTLSLPIESRDAANDELDRIGSSVRFSKGRDITQTPAFREWFGDSAVTDDAGNPEVVYHGTQADFKVFDASKAGTASAHPTSVLGFYASTDPRVAEIFGRDFKLNEGDSSDLHQVQSRISEGQHTLPLYMAINKPYRMSAATFGHIVQTYDPKQLETLRAQLESSGHDGILVRRAETYLNSETVGDTWIAFSPNQIKSATGNNGEFDFDNGDITRSKAREYTRGDPMEVSTRAPWSKKPAADAIKDLLVVGLDSSRAAEKAFEKNVLLVQDYPNYRETKSASTIEKQAERFLDHVESNLLWLYDQVPANIRERSHLWYDGAKAISSRWAPEYNLKPSQAAGAMAVLSPQKDWFMNVDLAHRVIDILSSHQAHMWDKDMSSTASRIFGKPQYAEDVKAIRGKRLSDIDDLALKAMWVRTFDEAHNARRYDLLSPEGDAMGKVQTMKGVDAKVAWGGLDSIAKAISIIEDGSLMNVSARLGNEHKVRNFYNNILVPNSDNGHVTIDTHAVAAALLRPLSGSSAEVFHNFGSAGAASNAEQGSSGTYGLYAEAYRRAAEARGVLPREMQSITWEAVRGLFTAGFKSQKKNTDAADAIWENHKKGRLSLENTRQQLLELAGGIEAPSWFESGAGSPSVEGASDAGVVPGVQLPGRSAGPAAGGAGSAAAGASATEAQRSVADPRSSQANPAAEEIKRSAPRGGRDERGNLGGLPTKIAVKDLGEIEVGHWAPAEKVARAYTAAAGIKYTPPSEFVKVDRARAERIAAAYEEMKHAPQDPDVKAAYAALIDEVTAQYEAVMKTGLKVEFIDFEKQGDPYAASPRLATEDVRNNNHFWVFGTRDGFGSSELDVSDNPMLAETKYQISGKPALANDLFRVVHDYFGHVKEGVGFRADGEENAWRAHSAMFTPLARQALTSETRGQNSWVNYGPHGEKNRTASSSDTHYADQKVGLMPAWTSEEGANDDAKSARPAELIELRKRKSVLESILKCLG